MATRVRQPRARRVAGKIIPLEGLRPTGGMLPTPWLGHKKLSPAMTFTDGQADVLIPGLSFEDIRLPDTVRALWGLNISVGSSDAAYMTVTVELVSEQPLAGEENPVVAPVNVPANAPYPISLSGAFTMQAGVEFSLCVRVRNARGDSPTSTVYANGTVWVDTHKVP